MIRNGKKREKIVFENKFEEMIFCWKVITKDKQKDLSSRYDRLIKNERYKKACKIKIKEK